MEDQVAVKQWDHVATERIISINIRTYPKLESLMLGGEGGGESKKRVERRDTTMTTTTTTTSV